MRSTRLEPVHTLAISAFLTLALAESGCIADAPECDVDVDATSFSLDDDGMLVATWQEDLGATQLGAWDDDELVYQAVAGQEVSSDSESDGESFSASAGVGNRSLSSPLATASLEDDRGASAGFTVTGDPRLPTGRALHVVLDLQGEDGACHSVVGRDVPF
jgi:hypothetical protein